ncbi:putative lipopolysaccharide heptosyltransferase III [Thiobacter aerophilum]|uniref:Lipopolysaccharide heptosyltransferase III n=1 Tax=Thiobacter aerophilum TaxID=3121275 RepID=A0ABV0EF97_9BURK
MAVPVLPSFLPLPDDAIDLERLRRVLVIKLRHLGDVLLTSPVFSVLARRAPHLELDALVYRDCAVMLEGHPAITHIHTIDKRWKTLPPATRLRAEWSLLKALKARRYDLVIHLTEHPRGAWLARLTGARYGVARQRPGRFWRGSFSHLYPWLAGNRRHTVELHLDALRRIGIQPQPHERGLTFVPGAEAEAAVDALLAAHGLTRGGFLVFHPGSRWWFKTWPAGQAAQLVDGLAARGWPVVLTAAPEPAERAFLAQVRALSAAPVVDLGGHLGLKELGALIGRARLFIGMDSAPMHLSAAMGTPTVALFGPSGEREWGPWGVPSRILTSAHSCRPCGQDGCGSGKVSECLLSIEPQLVLEAVEELVCCGDG